MIPMSPKRYVICDIEATGLDADRDLIEIALITLEDDRIVEVFETLINPLRPIPEFISGLTSITNRELQAAPKFYDLADAIRLRLEGAVFVSHNTDFDLGLLKKKYAEMGQELKLKHFCTLRVAQEEIPGLLNYNLDALCSFFRIKIEDRHRAIGDARATLELFRELGQLRLKTYPKILFLPQHERLLKKIPAKAGLLSFRDSAGKVFRQEASFNMEKTARELLMVRPENRDRLRVTQDLLAEVTGSALIAEFQKVLRGGERLSWVIDTHRSSAGEDSFRIRPRRKGVVGLWYFQSFDEARDKLRVLEAQLRTEKFLYREGGRSKEEILRQNQKVEKLSREARFPSENLVMVGEGRTLGERCLVLVRENHVVGYGYTEAPEEEIYRTPERFLLKRFVRHLGVDLAGRRYLRVLKNLRQKTDAWRELSLVPQDFHRQSHT